MEDEVDVREVAQGVDVVEVHVRDEDLLDVGRLHPDAAEDRRRRLPVVEAEARDPGLVEAAVDEHVTHLALLVLAREQHVVHREGLQTLAAVDRDARAELRRQVAVRVAERPNRVVSCHVFPPSLLVDYGNLITTAFGSVKKSRE